MMEKRDLRHEAVEKGDMRRDICDGGKIRQGRQGEIDKGDRR
jgi:hypothetical protein